MKSKSSISSLESAASASDWKQPDLFGQSPSVSKTHTAKPSSESTGLTHQSTTTFENLKETRNPPLQMELTSSAEGSRNCASLGVKPGSSEAQKMTEISGRKCCELLKLYNLDGLLAKMSVALLTSRWASDAAFLTWKASGIKPSHLLFQLAPSMPCTAGIASGLWATPSAADSVGSTGGGQGKSLRTDVRMWPTPNASDCKQANMKDDHDLKKGYLRGVVKMWPTPSTRDHKGGYQGGRVRNGKVSMDTLDVAVQHTDNQQKNGGQLNPTWVEWLMGYEIGHTDLKPSEMPLSRKSSRKSAKPSLRQSDDLS